MSIVTDTLIRQHADELRRRYDAALLNRAARHAAYPFTVTVVVYLTDAGYLVGVAKAPDVLTGDLVTLATAELSPDDRYRLDDPLDVAGLLGDRIRTALDTAYIDPSADHDLGQE